MAPGPSFAHLWQSEELGRVLSPGLLSGRRGGGHGSRSPPAAEPVGEPRPPDRDQRAPEKVPAVRRSLENGQQEECLTRVCLLLLLLRLDEETQQRFAAEEQLMAAQDRLKR